MYAPPEMKIFEISPKMRRFGGKRWEKLWIRWNWPFRVNLSLILGEKIEKYAKMAILTQSNPFFWPNLPLWVIFSRIGVKQFEKVEKLKKFADVPPPEMKIFEISPKMRCFGGKRWEKLWIRWNWPFRVNLNLILGEKIEKYAKMAILTQSKPLFWPNLPLWVIFSCIGVKQFEKVEKLKKIADVPPRETKIFFTPKTLISQKLLIIDTWNHCHWIRHTQNQSVGVSSSFDAFFLLKIKKMLTEQNWDWYRKKTSVLTGK